MENRVGSILKEFEYKWVSSVREMVRKMEKELTGADVEESPIKDCQSAFWVTPSNTSSDGDDEDEDTENVPPKTPSTSSVKRVQNAGRTPAGPGLEKKRKLTSVVSYLEAQHKANKRRKDSQPDANYQLYTVTPTIGSPQNLNTRRILNFEEMEEPTNKSSPLQEIEVVEIYQDTGTNQNLYFTPSPNPNSVPGGHNSSDSDASSVSLDAEELLKQVFKSRDLPGNANLHFGVRNAGFRIRTVRQTPFPVMTAIEEADDDSE